MYLRCRSFKLLNLIYKLSRRALLLLLQRDGAGQQFKQKYLFSNLYSWEKAFEMGFLYHFAWQGSSRWMALEERSKGQSGERSEMGMLISTHQNNILL